LIIKAYERANIKTDFIGDKEYTRLWWRNDTEKELLVESMRKNGFFFIPRKDVLEGDVVLIRIFGKKYPICHCGIVVSPAAPIFIHAKNGNARKHRKVCMEEVDRRFYGENFGVFFMCHESLKG
jgi:hypothetical protein